MTSNVSHSNVYVRNVYTKGVSNLTETTAHAPSIMAGFVATTSAAANIVLALVGASFVAHLFRLFQRHTFWYDEAMLIANITDGAWRDIVGPLPFYDQAGPVLYLLLLKCVHALFGLSEIALRAPSWIAALAADAGA
jgi:hypothetical protein